MNPPTYCRACPEPVLWVTMHKTGKRNPLNVAEIPVHEVAPGKNIVAVNPTPRTGETVTKDNIDDVPDWAARGVTFHISHWSTCAARKAIREETDAGETRECPIDGCKAQHARSLLMCSKHWREVPKTLRDALWDAYNGPGVGSEEYSTARDRCIGYVEAHV